MADMTSCHLKIAGMYCVQCEQRIKRALQSIDGIRNIRVSYKKASADFECEGVVSHDSIVKAIEHAGYKVVGTAGRQLMMKSILSIITILLLYVLLQYTGLLNRLAPSQLAQSGMGYGTLFLIGLVTSVHCIAMCGGIGLSQSLPDPKRKTGSFRRTLLYNLGRVSSYTFIGTLLGTVGFLIGGGSAASVPLTLQGVIKILAGIMLLVMGLRLMGAFSWLQRFSIPFPKVFLRFFGKVSSRAGNPFVIGLLNCLMPCGPLQAMWLIALASASPMQGALSMLLFSLGTLPLMLGLGSIVAVLGRKFARAVQRVGAVIVAVMGLALFTQGGVLSGVLPVGMLSAGAAKNQAVNMGDIQIVETELSPGSYPEITVQSGVPVRWKIHVDQASINGCNNTLVSPDLGLEYEFHAGDNIIEFTPKSVGDIGYSCWMGMINGTIHVAE